MFYSEASQLIKSSKNYQIEHAHDQVEAIRLTHCIPDDQEKLYNFINFCRTFDEAYTYLQNLAAEKRTKVNH